MTEDEVDCGIFKIPHPNNHCLCYQRDLQGLHDHLSDKLAAKYTDVIGADVDVKAQQLLHSLKREKIPSRLCSENVRSYSIPWVSGGINPNDARHAQYLDIFCGHIFEDLKGLIDRALLSRSPKDTVMAQLHREVLHHATFCVSKCESFHGREEILAQIQSFLSSNHQKPLVVYGKSGCGKTSIMAKVAASVRKWLGKSCACVLRFLGTSPTTSTIREALVSVCLQICFIYSIPPPVFDKMDIIAVLQFRSHLFESLVPSDVSLVIVLDSIDQLLSWDGAHTMKWLSKHLPPNIHFIVSMLPEEHGCLRTLQSGLLFQECYVKVDAMPVSTGIEILNSWLAKAGRVITPEQKEVVSEMFSACPQPLLLKLIFRQALQWKSYTPPETIILASSTTAALTQLFEQLEEQHGNILVQHALGYLTATRNGLTEAELEDVLSLDDQVLDDVYQYWDPPVKGIVRIPPLLWKRIRHDIDDYLVTQLANGKTVLVWYHRQFIETACHRYLGNDTQKYKCHSILATYFEGTWSDGKLKPVTLSHRQLVLENVDRQVASQPLKFTESIYNLRKLSELPYHLCFSGQLDTLKQIALCNFDWQLSKIHAESYTSLMQDYRLAISVFVEDDDLSVVSETLSLSSSNIQADPSSLPGQLLGRLLLVKSTANSQHLSRLLDQAHSWVYDNKDCHLVPKNSCLINPGGPLKTTLSGHYQLIQQLSVSAEDQIIVSASKGKSSAVFKVWDVSSIDCIENTHTLGITGSGLPHLTTLKGIVMGSCDTTVKVWNAKTGELIQTCEAPSTITQVSATSDAQLLVFATESGNILLYERCFGKPPQSLACHKTAIQALAICKSDRYLVSCSQDGKVTISILSPKAEIVHTIAIHTQAITCVSTICYKGQTIAVTGSEDESVKVLNVEKGLLLHTLTGHNKSIKCLETSTLSNNPVAISGSLDMTLRLWDITAGTCLNIFTGHTNNIWCMAILQSSQVVSGSKDDYLKVWDLSTGKCLHTLQGHSSWISCVAILRDDIIISASNDKNVKVWQLKDPKYPQPEQHSTQPECIAATNTGLVISGSQSDMKIWRTSDGSCLHTWQTSCSVLATDDIDLLFSGAKDGKITIWDLRSFWKIRVLEGHSGAVTTLQLMHDAILLSGSADGTIRCWDKTTALCNHILSGHSAGIKCIAVSKNDSIAVSGSHDCSIQVWDITTGKCSNVLSGHTKVIWCIGISDNNETVASGSDDWFLRIWNLKDSSCLHAIQYPDGVKCLVFANNHTVIAGAHCAHNQLRSWSVDTGECLYTYKGHNHAVMCMVLTDKGTHLITGSRDGTVKVWQASSAELLTSFDLQSQIKNLALVQVSQERLALSTTTKSGPIAVFDVML